MTGKEKRAFEMQGVCYTLGPIEFVYDDEAPMGTPDALVFPDRPIYPKTDLAFCNGAPLLVDFKTAKWIKRTWFQRLTDRFLDIIYRLFPPSGSSR